MTTPIALAKTDNNSMTPRSGVSRRHLVGIDVGGTKIHAAVADLDGVVIAERVDPTGNERGANLAANARRVVELLLLDADLALDTVARVGVGVAGVVDHSASELLRAPNLGSFDGVDILAIFQSAFDVPVHIDNDVNLAALGEQRYGLGRDVSDFVVIAVGTGIGMGIIANGRLLRGANGAAGEIGYLPIGADPLDEANQRRGPLEEVLAGASIASRYNATTGTNVGTPEVFSFAADGDASAQQSIEVEAEFVAKAIVAVSAVLDPVLFILSGGIGTRPGFADLVTPWLGSLGASRLRVRPSDLANTGSVLGAIELARQSHSDFRRETTPPVHQETPATDHYEGTP